MSNRIFSIAIDGPAGAGKSTVARAVAAKTGCIYVDTGALYRTIGLAAIKAGIASKDIENIEKLLPDTVPDIVYGENGEQLMFLNGENVTAEIRTPECSVYASDVSAFPAVRAFLLEKQRELARVKSVIMDGRDIGTVVLPGADVKIFLTADLEVRAARRFNEFVSKGINTPMETVLKDIAYRDEQDSNRAVAPLKPAEDSVILDTSEMSFDSVVEAVLKIVSEKVKL